MWPVLSAVVARRLLGVFSPWRVDTCRPAPRAVKRGLRKLAAHHSSSGPWLRCG